METVILFSDGATSQYKTSTILSIFAISTITLDLKYNGIYFAQSKSILDYQEWPIHRQTNNITSLAWLN